MGFLDKFKRAIQGSNRHVTVDAGDDFSVGNEANLEYGNLGQTGETIEDAYRPDESDVPPDAGSGQVL
jgi:hypothetical protein